MNLFEPVALFEWENSTDWRKNPNLPIPVGAKALTAEETQNRLAERKKYNAELNKRREAYLSLIHI